MRLSFVVVGLLSMFLTVSARVGVHDEEMTLGEVENSNSLDAELDVGLDGHRQLIDQCDPDDYIGKLYLSKGKCNRRCDNTCVKCVTDTLATERPVVRYSCPK